jgi:hypothetical protein
VVTTYSYDTLNRLTQVSYNVSGATGDLTGVFCASGSESAEHDRELLHLLPDRTVWLLEADHPDVQLRTWNCRLLSISCHPLGARRRVSFKSFRSANRAATTG